MKKLTMSGVIFGTDKISFPRKKFNKLVKIKKNMLNLKTSEAVLSFNTRISPQGKSQRWKNISCISL